RSAGNTASRWNRCGIRAPQSGSRRETRTRRSAGRSSHTEPMRATFRFVQQQRRGMSIEIDLSGRGALVTGSGAGIGREIARWLARAGAQVVVDDVRAVQAESGVGGERRARRGA